MRILHVDLDFGTGGAEKFIVHLSKEQTIHHQVTVVSLWDINPKIDIFVNQLDSRVKFITLNKKKGFDIKTVVKLISFLKKNKFDAVHTHRSTINYVLLIKIFFLKDLNITHTIHNDAFKETPNKILRFIKSYFIKSGYFKPVTISDESNQSFVKAYNLNSPIIYNGTPKLTLSKHHLNVKQEMQIYKGEGELILSVGRISKQKNYQSLINVIEELNHEGFNLSLVIIGRQELKLDISLNNKIHLLGVKSNPFDYMNNTDFFCLASLYEGLPITLIESVQSSALNIVTPVGGMPDIIKNLINGFVTKGVTENAIKITIKKALQTTKNERQKFVSESQKIFNKKLNIKNVSIDYEKIYNS
jgi:glycosyltransferase involved in cell wall biosynthesis